MSKPGSLTERPRYYYFHDFVTIQGIRMLAERLGQWRVHDDRVDRVATIELNEQQKGADY